MQPGERTAASHLEEDRILEGIDAAQCDRQSTHVRDDFNDRLGELFEPRFTDLVRFARRRDHEPQLLEHVVQEMIRVNADTAEASHLLAEDGQFWLQSPGWDPRHACRVWAAMRPPIRGIVPT